MSHSRHRHVPDTPGRASRKKLGIIALGSAAVIIAGVIVITQTVGTSAKHAAAAQPSASVTATASPGASHSQSHLRTVSSKHRRSGTPAPPKVRVIDTYRGVGSRKTGGFTVLGTGDWVLKWSYRCPASSTTGSFVVSEDGGFDEDGVNVDSHGSARHGQTRVFGDVGHHYLSVQSTCSWKVEVTGRW